jgi:transcriptional antiterminator RfaH
MSAIDVDMEEKSGWVVVNTQANREMIALDHLTRQHFSTYCPVVRRRVRHARQTREVLRPLFSGYLFVRMCANGPGYRSIAFTRGVRSLVRFGERPALLSDTFICELKSREIDGAIVQCMSRYSIGQAIRVTDGPFADLVGTIVALDDDRARIVALLNFLSRPVKVNLPPGMAVPAWSASAGRDQFARTFSTV